MVNEPSNSSIKYQRFVDDKKQNSKVKYENYSVSSKDGQFHGKVSVEPSIKYLLSS